MPIDVPDGGLALALAADSAAAATICVVAGYKTAGNLGHLAQRRRSGNSPYRLLTLKRLIELNRPRRGYEAADGLDACRSCQANAIACALPPSRSISSMVILSSPDEVVAIDLVDSKVAVPLGRRVPAA